MMVDRYQAKQAARNCMRSARVSPYQIGLVYFLLVFALNSFDVTITRNFSAVTYLDAYTTLTMPTPLTSFVSVLVWLLLIMLEAGFATYCLGIRRGKEMPLGTLFDGFSIVGKVVLLNLVMTLFIFLWCLLFIIPGIIAAYRYRFALYNLLENPDIGIMEAIRLSKEQTKGYKWDLFILDLSFLGWVILSVFTLGLLTIWLNPYMTLTDIAYYDTICSLKGMTAAGQSGWTHGAPDDGPYHPPYQANGEQQNSPWNGASAQQPERPPYDYDWNHQNNSWNSAGTGTGAAAPEQPQTPPALQMPDPPAAPEVPQQPESRSDADPWERKENQEPWNRGDQNTP